jgi:hypothetical protein
MVVFVVGDDYADGEFTLLSKHLSLLDTELERINIAIKNSRDPDTDGLCDSGEYFIGFGFIAIQQYIASTFPQTGIPKKEALKFPPAIKSDLTVMEALNAGANYWKHYEEWGFHIAISEDVDSIEGLKKITITRNRDVLTKNDAKNTLTTIEKITPWADYTCANLLAELLPNKEMKLTPLLTYIVEWRKNLMTHSSTAESAFDSR